MKRVKFSIPHAGTHEQKPIWELVYRYHLRGDTAFLALLLLKFNGLISAVRFLWHAKKVRITNG